MQNQPNFPYFSKSYGGSPTHFAPPPTIIEAPPPPITTPPITHKIEFEDDLHGLDRASLVLCEEECRDWDSLPIIISPGKMTNDPKKTKKR